MAGKTGYGSSYSSGIPTPRDREEAKLRKQLKESEQAKEHLLHYIHEMEAEHRSDTPLEKWKNGEKGRYVRDLGIDTGYGATCWNLVLGNVDRKPGKKWHKDKYALKQLGLRARAEVYASEVDFFEVNNRPPNVVTAQTGDEEDFWPGLNRTIEAAIKKADELGL